MWYTIFSLVLFSAHRLRSKSKKPEKEREGVSEQRSEEGITCTILTSSTRSIAQSVIVVKVPAREHVITYNQVALGEKTTSMDPSSYQLTPTSPITNQSIRDLAISNQPPHPLCLYTMAPIGVQTYPNRPCRLLNLNKSSRSQKRM